MLNEHQIRYCILRWFEDLPKVAPDEDIDLLVDDPDFSAAISIIDRRPGIVPFDIYTKSGLPGSDYSGLPYYKHSLAEKALDRAYLYKDIFKVPLWEDYFYLLAYHAVFHKGENSGLACKNHNLLPAARIDHDYLFHLKEIRSKTDLPVDDFSLEGLHAFLENRDLVPPMDMQYKLSRRNNYLKSYLDDHYGKCDLVRKYEGLVCFIARDKVLETGSLEDMKKLIYKEGFTLLRTVHLDDVSREAFKIRARGGNWNQGPWPTNGGLPAVLLIAMDVYPLKPEHKDLQLHPGLTNRRIRNKKSIRDFINMRLPHKSQWFNGIHSSDNELQALEYLSLAGVDPEEICRDIIRHKESFKTDYPVIANLTQYSKRAKVELISYKGQKAIKKTFKPYCEPFLNNEIEAYQTLAGVINIPKLLESGPNYIITSYIEGANPLGHRIKISLLRQCIRMLRAIYDRGYSLLDFKPGNFVIGPNNIMYLIDFEHLYKYAERPPFLECYDLLGIPDTLDLTRIPNNRIPKDRSQYDTLWARYTYVHYDELSRLDSLPLMIKSCLRYRYDQLDNMLALYREQLKQQIKACISLFP